MSEKLKILMIAAEAAPFAKEGGLGDVVGTLPRILSKRGHDVRVVIPRYYKIDREKLGLKPVNGPLSVPMGIISVMWCAVLEGRMPGSDVPIYFIEHEQFYGREALYHEEGQRYPDSDNRFVFLSRAGLELCRMINFKPDVVHAHDWHTAAVPIFLNTLYRNDPLLKDTASVLTIHSIQHQGIFYKGLMDVLGVGWEQFTVKGLEFNDQTNLLKGGIYNATLINAVSPTYAKEIQTPSFGYDLDGVMRDRAADLYGILNGVDYDEWNPENDPLIIAPYDEYNRSGKALCKRELQETFGLSPRPDIPVIGMVSRLTNQKGIDVLAQATHRIMGLDIQFVLLGAGDVWAHFYFGDLPNRYPGRFGCYIGYDNTRAHTIMAGSDFFLVPSRYEPCGLTQMYALRYGTLPIVRSTGGLNDTVENFNETTHEGTGFVFHDLTAKALYDTIAWAVDAYRNKAAMETLIARAMNRRFSWEDAAAKYEALYELAVSKRSGR